MRTRGALGIVAVLAALGCDRKDGPAPTNPDGQVSQTVVQPGSSTSWMVEGVGNGEDRQSACDAAIGSLARELFGGPGWPTLVPVELSEVLANARSFEAQSGQGAQCRVGLDRSGAAALLLEFEQTPPVVGGPPGWHDTLFSFASAHRASQGCARRAALFGVACETVDIDEAERLLRSLSSGVSLAPIYFGGAPIDSQGRLLRTPGIIVMLHGVPAASVPVVGRASGVDEPNQRLTTPDGLARFGRRGGRWSGPVVVSIDADAMLGPLAYAWPPDAVTLEGRAVDARRWRAVAGERRPSPFVKQISDALVRRGLPAPPDIDSEAERSLHGVTPSDLPVLADVLAGRLDVVFMVSVRTRFVGRASGSRVWNEAAASAEVYEVWTGRRLTGVTASAKGSGAGDQAAAEDAMRRVVDPLVSAILSDPAVPVPDESRPSASAKVSTAPRSSKNAG